MEDQPGSPSGDPASPTSSIISLDREQNLRDLTRFSPCTRVQDPQADSTNTVAPTHARKFSLPKVEITEEALAVGFSFAKAIPPRFGHFKPPQEPSFAPPPTEPGNELPKAAPEAATASVARQPPAPSGLSKPEPVGSSLALNNAISPTQHSHEPLATGRRNSPTVSQGATPTLAQPKSPAQRSRSPSASGHQNPVQQETQPPQGHQNPVYQETQLPRGHRNPVQQGRQSTLVLRTRSLLHQEIYSASSQQLTPPAPRPSSPCYKGSPSTRDHRSPSALQQDGSDRPIKADCSSPLGLQASARANKSVQPLGESRASTAGAEDCPYVLSSDSDSDTDDAPKAAKPPTSRPRSADLGTGPRSRGVYSSQAEAGSSLHEASGRPSGGSQQSSPAPSTSAPSASTSAVSVQEYRDRGSPAPREAGGGPERLLPRTPRNRPRQDRAPRRQLPTQDFSDSSLPDEHALDQDPFHSQPETYTHQFVVSSKRKHEAMGRALGECIRVAEVEFLATGQAIESLEGEMQLAKADLDKSHQLLSEKDALIRESQALAHESEARCREWEEKGSRAMEENERLVGEIEALRLKLSNAQTPAGAMSDKYREYREKLNEAIEEQQDLFARARDYYESAITAVETQNERRASGEKEVAEALEASRTKRAELEAYYRQFCAELERETLKKDQAISQLQTELKNQQEQLTHERMSVAALQSSMTENANHEHIMKKLQEQDEKYTAKFGLIMECLKWTSENRPGTAEMTAMADRMRADILTCLGPDIQSIRTGQQDIAQLLRLSAQKCSRKLHSLKKIIATSSTVSAEDLQTAMNAINGTLEEVSRNDRETQALREALAQERGQSDALREQLTGVEQQSREIQALRESSVEKQNHTQALQEQLADAEHQAREAQALRQTLAEERSQTEALREQLVDAKQQGRETQALRESLVEKQNHTQTLQEQLADAEHQARDAQALRETLAEERSQAEALREQLSVAERQSRETRETLAKEEQNSHDLQERVASFERQSIHTQNLRQSLEDEQDLNRDLQEQLEDAERESRAARTLREDLAKERGETRVLKERVATLEREAKDDEARRLQLWKDIEALEKLGDRLDEMEGDVPNNQELAKMLREITEQNEMAEETVTFLGSEGDYVDAHVAQQERRAEERRAEERRAEERRAEERRAEEQRAAARRAEERRAEEERQDFHTAALQRAINAGAAAMEAHHPTRSVDIGLRGYTANMRSSSNLPTGTSSSRNTSNNNRPGSGTLPTGTSSTRNTSNNNPVVRTTLPAWAPSSRNTSNNNSSSSGGQGFVFGPPHYAPASSFVRRDRPATPPPPATYPSTSAHTAHESAQYRQSIRDGMLPEGRLPSFEEAQDLELLERERQKRPATSTGDAQNGGRARKRARTNSSRRRR